MSDSKKAYYEEKAVEEGVTRKRYPAFTVTEMGNGWLVTPAKEESDDGMVHRSKIHVFNNFLDMVSHLADIYGVDIKEDK